MPPASHGAAVSTTSTPAGRRAPNAAASPTAGGFDRGVLDCIAYAERVDMLITAGAPWPAIAPIVRKWTARLRSIGLDDSGVEERARELHANGGALP